MYSGSVLVVDDDPDQRRQIAWAVEEAGFPDIVTAGSAEDAINLIEQRHQFPIAVIDIQLSRPVGRARETGGLNVIRKLHASQPDSRIIGLTSKYDDVGPDCIAAGASDFVYMGWDSIDWRQLLLVRLHMWAEVAPAITAATP